MVGDPLWTVGIAPCSDYTPECVGEALELATTRAGGLSLPPVDEVLFKVNLLAPRPPEDAVTTHPQIVAATSQLLRKQQFEGTLRVADNPGYVFASAFQKLLAITGMANVGSIENLEVGLLSDNGVQELEGYEGKRLNAPRVSSRYLNSPFVVNIAKLKTHVETEMTGCIKNIFGIADIQTRKSAHSSRSKWDLMDAILDLFMMRPPNFNILDAVYCMEGNGPSHGKPRRCGWIVAGAEAAAVDYVGAMIMGYKDPLKIPLLRVASTRLGMDLCPRTIRLLGADWDQLPVEGFQRSTGALRMLPTFLRGWAHSLVSMRPSLSEQACTRCTICAKVCPVDAIEMKLYPVIDKKRCVSCLCCHEMCPTGAMQVARNWLAEALAR